MSEGGSRQGIESPLRSERGKTKIKDSVVAKIAGLAAQEVEGVHMGGGTARAASGLVQRAPATGSSGPGDMTRGVSVEVGEFETAIDLKMDVEYGRNIIGTVEQVRSRIQDQVGYMTGLKVTELNATVNDVVPAGTGEGRASRRSLGGGGGSRRPELDSFSNAREVRTREIRPGIREEGTVEVEPRERTHTDLSGEVAPEPVRVEDRPLDEGETAEISPGTDEARRGPLGREGFETRTDRGTGSGTDRGASGGSEGDDEPRTRRRRRER